MKKALKRLVVAFGILLVLFGIWQSFREPWVTPCPGVDLTPRLPPLREADVVPGTPFYVFREATSFTDDGSLAFALDKLGQTGWPRAVEPLPKPVHQEAKTSAADSTELAWPDSSVDTEEMAEMGKGNDLDDSDAWEGSEWTEAQVKAIEADLAAMEEFFQLAREAVRMPNPQVPTVVDFNSLLPYLSPVRSLARGLSVSSFHKAHQGDFRGAFDDLELAIRVGNFVARGGCMINHLVCIACCTIASRTAWDLTIFYPVPAEELERFLAVLVEIEREVEPFSETFKYENICVQNTVDEFVRRGPSAFSGAGGSSSPFYMPVFGTAATTMLGSSPSTMKRNFGYAYAHMVALADAPYDPAAISAFENSLVAFKRGRTAIFLLRDPVGALLASMTIPAVVSAIEKDTMYKAQLRSLMAYFGVLAFKASHDRLPDGLAPLVPEFLETLPVDPFDGNPLRFKVSVDGTWYIYSVGKNQADDGGDGRSWFSTSAWNKSGGRRMYRNKDLIVPGQPFPKEPDDGAPPIR